MKALYLAEMGDPSIKSDGRLILKEDLVPECGPEDVLIKIAYCAICGSDGHSFRGNMGPYTEVIKQMLPMTMGHEMSGIIESVGETAANFGFKPGDRVTANYTKFCGTCHYCRTGRENFCQHPIPNMAGMSELYKCHMSQVYKIPDGVSLKCASLTEPMSIAFGAVEMANVKMGSTVAIFGGGGIGQMAAMLAKNAGAAKVIVFEPVQEKRELVIKLGADGAYDSIHEDVSAITAEITGGLGFDCVLEASGAAGAANSALQVLGMDGNLVYFAMYPSTYMQEMNLFTNFYMQQKHVHGMATTADQFLRVIEMLPRIELGALIQKIYTLDEYEQAFADQMSGQFVKILFKCNDIE